MAEPDSLATTIRRIADLLDGLGVRYHCTGGLVASLYGEPRLTQDIDIVISIRSGPDVERLISLLGKDHIIDPNAIRDGVRRQTIFQALDGKTYIKTDFHVGEAVPGELDRSCRCELLPGLSVPVVSREDAILSKLLWVQQGSHRSRRDIAMMLKRPGSIEWDRLESMASRLGVKDLLDELRLVDG